jgi:hypothetical protein
MAHRNHLLAKVNWQFTIKNARIKPMWLDSRLRGIHSLADVAP